MSDPVIDSALIRLTADRPAGEAFLQPHHLAAAQRFEALVERARMIPRVTMSYDLARVGGTRRAGGNATATVSDTAAEARSRLNRLADSLPADCWNVLFDVCGLGKGLQVIEAERRWPRRSAKLVLRIALDHLAGQYGLAAQATGVEQGRNRGWLAERLPLIADERPQPCTRP